MGGGGFCIFRNEGGRGWEIGDRVGKRGEEEKVQKKEGSEKRVWRGRGSYLTNWLIGKLFVSLPAI